MIIAEISQNFNNLQEAKELIRLAKENGADLAKAQLFDSMALYGEHTPSELSFADARALFEYGEEVGIEVFFSVFDILRVKWCEEIGVKRYKIACNQNNNIKLLKCIGETNKPTIISYDSFSNTYLNVSEPSTLYCPSGYPPDYIQMPDFGESVFDGFSDHTVGLDAVKIAIARGARIIEKHFCIDHKTGIDAEWSMTPSELRELRRWADICTQVLNYN